MAHALLAARVTWCGWTGCFDWRIRAFNVVGRGAGRQSPSAQIGVFLRCVETGEEAQWSVMAW